MSAWVLMYRLLTTCLPICVFHLCADAFVVAVTRISGIIFGVITTMVRPFAWSCLQEALLCTLPKPAFMAL